MPILLIFGIISLVLLSKVGSKPLQQGTKSKTLIGSLVLVLIGALNTDLGGIMVFGIICTGGLGFIPFFAIAWMIGTVLMAIPLFITHKSNPVRAETKTSAPISGDKTLRAYVNEAHGEGMSHKEMRRRLLKNGWDESQVDRIIKEELHV